MFRVHLKLNRTFVCLLTHFVDPLLSPPQAMGRRGAAREGDGRVCDALLYVTCTHGVAPKPDRARSGVQRRASTQHSRLRTLQRSLEGRGRAAAGWLGLRVRRRLATDVQGLARAALAPLVDLRSLRRPCWGAVVGRAGVHAHGGWVGVGGWVWVARAQHVVRVAARVGGRGPPVDIRRRASVGTCAAAAWTGRMTLVRGGAPPRPGADGGPLRQENIRARGARARARSARTHRGNVRICASKVYHSAYFCPWSDS